MTNITLKVDPNSTKPLETLRILHMGNIAGNAYNIARFLRRRGIEADVFANGYTYHIGSPEWEEADFDESVDEWNQDWSQVNLHGFRRPKWFFVEYSPQRSKSDPSTNKPDLPRLRGILQYCPLGYTLSGSRDGLAHDWHRLRFISRNLLAKTLRLIKGVLPYFPLRYTLSGAWHGLTQDRRRIRMGVKTLLGYIPRHYAQIPKSYRWVFKEYEKHVLGPGINDVLRQGDVLRFLSRGHFTNLFRQYDIIQAYGLWEPPFPMLLTPEIPLVVFEHGTLRELPFHNDSCNKMYALACQRAHSVIITNPDGYRSAQRLGLNNFVFIPHPIDDEIFRPRNEEQLRQEILNETGDEFIILAPARHNWVEKGNDVFIRGFRRVRQYGMKAILLLADWGQEQDKSQKLIHELGLERHVRWLPPLPKKKLARYYNAADLVYDQFVLGVFGTTAPEAMACAKPVIMKMDWEIHKWCFPEMPPIIHTESEEDVYRRTVDLLGDARARASIGKQGQAWFCRYHSPQIVVKRHLAIYNEILNS